MADDRAEDMTEREHRIRVRAWVLWQQAGSPDGRQDEFWRQAEQQITREEQDKRPDPPMPPRTRPL